MKKLCTHLFLIGTFVLGAAALNAQIIWPNDSISKRSSQFVDAATIRFVKKDTALNPSLNSFKGWITMGLASKVAAKADSAVFLWSADGTPKIGSFTKNDTRITSIDATGGFGAALFSSDYIDSRGSGTVGAGQAPSPHTSELWSPIFDATGYNDLSLIFQQTNRHFSSARTIRCWQSAAVSWSEDGGVTWKALQCIEENEGYGTIEFLPRNTPTVIKLKGSKGTSKFRVKFHFDGDYYYWLLDDVRVGVLKNNVTLSKSWVAVPPASQQRNNVDSVRFMVDVVNNGTVAAKNVKLTVDVLNSSTLAKVFTTSRDYGTLAPDSTAQNEVLPQAFVAPNAVATYDIRYKISYDSTDMFQRDDSIYFRAGMAVRDSFLTKEHGQFVQGAYGYDIAYDATAGSTKRTWKLGQYFYFPKGANSTATTISAAVDTETETARTYGAGLYEWNDLNSNGDVEANERNLIGYGEGTVPAASTTIDFVDIRLENFAGTSGKPIYLKNNQAYLAMLEMNPTRTGESWAGIFDDRPRFSYAPMRYAQEKVGKPRYSGILDEDASDPNSVWSTEPLGDMLYLPRVELWAWPIRIDTKDDLPATYKVAIFPNPVGQNLSVDVDFPKSEQAVLFRVFDLKGQLIQEREFMNIQKETVNMDVNQLASGEYLLQVQTIGNQAKTLKFVKVN